MLGQSPAQIDKAWNTIKRMDGHRNLSQEDPQFQDIMLQQLNHQKQPSMPSMPAPKPLYPNQISLKIPTCSSLNAPKPMIIFTVNGQQQANTAIIMNGQASPVPLQTIQHELPQISMNHSSPSTHQNVVECQSPQSPESEFDGASSVGRSERSYREKKNRVNWQHPYIIHLIDLGWSKLQIQTAYFLLNNGNEKRSKISDDDDKFLAFMIHILVEDLKYCPENPQRQFGESSECIDKMYQNFVCCLCCRILTKINDDNACCICCCCFMANDDDDDKTVHAKSDFTTKDNIFYFAMYLFVVGDFYCRIFPCLAYVVLLRTYLKTLTSSLIFNVFSGTAPMALVIALYELFAYYAMLKGKDQKMRIAIKYFWTGTFTISYYLLSTMHLTYIPCNVDFVKLYRAHWIRMFIQLLIMFIAIGIQYILFDDALGFFERTVFLFAFNWVLNLWILVWMRCYMNTFKNKIVDTVNL